MGKQKYSPEVGSDHLALPPLGTVPPNVNKPCQQLARDSSTSLSSSLLYAAPTPWT